MTKWEYFVAPLLEHNPGKNPQHVRRGRLGARGGDPIQNPMGGVSTVAYMKRPKG